MATIINPFPDVIVEPTAAQRLAEHIKVRAASVAPFLVNNHKDIYDMLWTHSVAQGTTPQAVLDELGPLASRLFANGATLIDFLQTNNYATFNQAEYVPKQTPIFNPDGTVTLA